MRRDGSGAALDPWDAATMCTASLSLGEGEMWYLGEERVFITERRRS